jgi:hypothetical protein
MGDMGPLSGITLALAAIAAAPAGGASEVPDGVRGCATRAEGTGPLHLRDETNLRIGPVVFYALARPTRLERIRGRDPSLKSGIAVRSGGPVLLRIPPRARADVALNYAARPDGSSRDVRRVADGQTLVRVTPCPPGTRRFTDGRRIGPWTGFAGGFVVRAAGCYPIEVARAGEPFKRRVVGFGRRCQKS